MTQDWTLMEPQLGPPLPRFMGIYWPWRVITERVIEPPSVVEPPAVPYVPPPTIIPIYAPSPPSPPIVIAYPPVVIPAVPYVPVEPPPGPTFPDLRLEEIIVSPSVVNVGDVIEVSVLARNLGDALGSEKVVCEADGLIREMGVTLRPGESKFVVFSFIPQEPGSYNVVVGNLRGRFEAIGLPVVPPVIPPVVPPPSFPTAEMLLAPSVASLPSQVTLGDIWTGNILIPTRWPMSLPVPSTLPSYPVAISAGLEGSWFSLGDITRNFTPGGDINFPVSFDTFMLPDVGNYNITMVISDLQGNELFSNIIGRLSVLEVPIIKPPLGYTLIASVVPAGSVNKEPDKPFYDEGSKVKLTASLPPVGFEGFTFHHWLIMNGEQRDIEENPATVTVKGNTIATAIYELGVIPQEFTIELHANPVAGGWVTRSPAKPTYAKYEIVTLTAWVLGDYRFDHWTNKDGTTLGTSNTIDIPMVRDEIITAHYVLPVVTPPIVPPVIPPPVIPPTPTVGYTLTAGAIPPGYGSIVLGPPDKPVVSQGPPIQYASGTKINLTARPGSAKRFDYWSGDASGSASTITVTMDRSKNIQANFSRVTAPVPTPTPTPAPPTPPLPTPGLPRADIDSYNFQMLTVGDVDPGATVSWKVVGRYKGKGQNGKITISLGTGTVLNYSARFTLPVVPVTFNESPDWQGFTFRGNFVIPAGAVRGQKYSLRAKLETFSDITQETDTDYEVIVISSAPPPTPTPTPTPPTPTPTPTPIPASQFRNFKVVKYATKPWRGGICAVVVGYDYKGPALSKTLYAAIGKITLGIFDEKYVGQDTIQVPESSNWAYHLGRVEIDIPSDAPLGNYYLEAKLITAGPDAISVRYSLEIIA